MEMLNILKCCSIIFWFFYSNNFLRQRKVTEAIRMAKLYCLLIPVYSICTGVELYFAYRFVDSVLNDEDVISQINSSGFSVE